MRTPFVAGNWKMHKTIAEARHLVSEMVPGLQAISSIDRVICPPFTTLLAVSALLTGTDIALGAQNMHWEVTGAFTGEISPSMVAELCKYVIIGHSERRAYFGEKDSTVNLKVQSALSFGIVPIICVGETLQENEAGLTQEVILHQIREGLAKIDIPDGNAFVIAYEPIWAIGTGRAATARGANEVIAGIIRSSIADLFGGEVADAVRILYGGSVKAENAADFFLQSDIDGALVGGASLKSPEFVKIAQAAAQVFTAGQ
jgi:triosephosphate isomerase